MELRHLRYFTAVVQWKGFREASRHLYVAQPSISEAIFDLESELGIKLFSREGRVARLTPEGQLFYEAAFNRPQLLLRIAPDLSRAFSRSSSPKPQSNREAHPHRGPCKRAFGYLSARQLPGSVRHDRPSL